MKQFRISRKMAENICFLNGCRLLAVEDLGNRSKPYYRYFVYNSDGKEILGDVSLKFIYNYFS